MELNGVSNIHAIIRVALGENTECHQSISVEVADKILEQLDTLIRYSVAVRDTMNPEQLEALPYWHEVRENKHKYVDHRGKLKAK